MMDRRSVGRPRDGNPAETRREILKAAEERFAAAGFAGATTREMAAKAGVNVATLHYHFGNKEGLYHAVLDQAISGNLPSEGSGGPPAERLARLVGQLWDYGAGRPSVARLSLLHLLTGPPPAPSAGVPDDPGEDPRVTLLTRALSGIAGPYPDAAPSPAFAARFIVTLLDGAHLALKAANGSGTSPAASAASRDAVVMAALRVAGLSR
jgi:AcrR family transcriptional regulator